MHHIFDISRTVRTYRLYFGERQADVLEELLLSVRRCLERSLPRQASRRIDAEGSVLVREGDGTLTVRRHPDLERSRRELARLGVFRIFLPEADGGFGLPLSVYYLVVQQVSYFDTSLALVFLVHGNAMYAIQRYGTEQQRARHLPALASGEQLASVAFTEPTAGSDAGSIRTRATLHGDHWLLWGEKLFITHGGDADLLITTARTGPSEEGIRGVSTFILLPAADGVELLGIEDKTGLAGSPTAALSYPDLCIPLDRMLGPEGRGGAVMFAGVGMTRVNIGAQALGIARRAFDAAADFALERQQGGVAIIEHDAIQQRLGQMALIISAMENLICHDSWLEQQQRWHVREMSIAKYYASEALQELTLRAINVFGGYGVCKEYEVERCRREAVALPLYGGTSEIQWYIIARELLGSLDRQGNADYRVRDQRWQTEVEQRCTDPALRAQADAVRRGNARLWTSAEQVATLDDAVPFHRHLADLATSLAVARVLLWQASAPGADELDRQLSAWAVDLLEDRAAVTCARIARGEDRAGIKGVVSEMIRGR